ncbi:hypothetical protein ACXWR7_13785, partial [Streptococcus pyogenes]
GGKTTVYGLKDGGVDLAPPPFSPSSFPSLPSSPSPLPSFSLPFPSPSFFLPLLSPFFFLSFSPSLLFLSFPFFLFS